jgi:hypothetical protein
MSRSTALAIYYASALLAGLIAGLRMLPEPVQFGVVLGIGVFALIYRSVVLHVGPWTRVDLAWGVVFVLTFLPIAGLLGHWPFQ